MKSDMDQFVRFNCVADGPKMGKNLNRAGLGMPGHFALGSTSYFDCYIV